MTAFERRVKKLREEYFKKLAKKAEATKLIKEPEKKEAPKKQTTKK